MSTPRPRELRLGMQRSATGRIVVDLIGHRPLSVDGPRRACGAVGAALAQRALVAAPILGARTLA